MAPQSRLFRPSSPRGPRDSRRHSIGAPLKDVGQPVAQLDVARYPQFGRDAFPFDEKRSEPTTARRLVRGDPKVDGPFDLWPGAKAKLRPDASCPDGVPQAEPSMVVGKKSRSAHAKKGESAVEHHSPPSRATDRLGGKDTPGLPPPCASWVYLVKKRTEFTSAPAPKTGGTLISSWVALPSTRSIAPFGAPCSSRSPQWSARWRRSTGS